jgi:hypothetical protein
MIKYTRDRTKSSRMFPDEFDVRLYQNLSSFIRHKSRDPSRFMEYLEPFYKQWEQRLMYPHTIPDGYTTMMLNMLKWLGDPMEILETWRNNVLKTSELRVPMEDIIFKHATKMNAKLNWKRRSEQKLRTYKMLYSFFVPRISRHICDWYRAHGKKPIDLYIEDEHIVIQEDPFEIEDPFFLELLTPLEKLLVFKTYENQTSVSKYLTRKQIKTIEGHLWTQLRRI